MNAISEVLTAVSSASVEPDPAEASGRFFAALAGFGATYLQTRVYRRPLEPLTNENHWHAGGVIARFCPEGWVGSAAFNYVCFECNPLLDAVRSGRTSWRFDDYAPKDERRFGLYWEALKEAKIGDAHGVIVHGQEGWLANIHLGIGDVETPHERRAALSFAALLMGDRLLTLSAPAATADALLTDRERDCLAFVAAGKTDWDIGMILGIAESTVKFHVDNARRKLNASTRAHAVAKLALRGGL